MLDIDYDEVRHNLEARFAEIEKSYASGQTPAIPGEVGGACANVFASNTQAYREVLLGCILVRLSRPGVNVRQPYVEQSDNAFSGRTLDERVVNPFLHSMQIPSSKGPYLSVFRRGIQFDESTRRGLRDKDAYDSFLQILDYIELHSSPQELNQLLNHVLFEFLSLREGSSISIAQLPRISLRQYESLIPGLLSVPSGGRVPVMTIISMLRTIAIVFHLEWTIEYSGINVADAATGASGDITVSNAGQPTMILEVTERPVGASRVQSTFRSKIATSGVTDYLFMVDKRLVGDDATEEASRYFAQGYEINFVDISSWLLMCLATLGSSGRAEYNRQLTGMFQSPDLPKAVKVGWNREVLKLAGA